MGLCLILYISIISAPFISTETRALGYLQRSLTCHAYETLLKACPSEWSAASASYDYWVSARK